MEGPLSSLASRSAGRRRSIALRQNELGLLLLIGELLAAALASYGSTVIWAAFDRAFTPTAGLPTWQLLFPIVWVVLLRLFGGGDIVGPRFGRRSIAASAQAWLAASGLVLALFFLAPFFAPRGSSLLMPAVAFATTLTIRFAFLKVVSGNVLERRVVVLGTDAAARRVAAVMARTSAVPYRVLCFFNGTSLEPQGNRPIPIRPLPADLWSALSELRADLVVVGHTRALPERVLAELVRCFEHGIEAVPATTLYEQLRGRVLASALEADWYADLPTSLRTIYAIVKRTFDIVLAAAGLAVFSPVMILIAFAILIDSGRPILIRQRRVGQRGHHFTLHKFRSMRADAEAGEALWASPDDPRRTRAGRLLRRTRLDELPQLWNIVAGDMSLIGPRPERPEFVNRLAHELPLYRARLLVRPGLTGWAQVMYPYAGSIEENLEKLEYDLYYIRHFGPLLDLSILLRTAGIVLGLSKPEFGEAPDRSTT